MNRELPPPSRALRSICAVAAVLATSLVARSIDGLVDHYAGAAAVASARSTQLARVPAEQTRPASHQVSENGTDRAAPRPQAWPRSS